MKEIQDRPETDLLREINQIQSSMAVLPTTRRLPVWVQVALVGAGLTLAPGCTDKPHAQTDPASERAQPQDEPAPDLSMNPPGMEPEGKVRTVVTTSVGVYGAPPMRSAFVSMIRIHKGTMTVNKPVPKTSEVVVLASIKYELIMPSGMTTSARTLFDDLRGAIDTCLKTAMEKGDLEATGFSVDMEFSQGSLKTVTLQNDKDLPAELRTCVQQAAESLRAKQPATPPKGEDSFTRTFSFDVSW